MIQDLREYYYETGTILSFDEDGDGITERLFNLGFERGKYLPENLQEKIGHYTAIIFALPNSTVQDSLYKIEGLKICLTPLMKDINRLYKQEHGGYPPCSIRGEKKNIGLVITDYSAALISY